MHHSNERRACCGHATEVSHDGYCTLLRCACYCRRFCAHLHVTVPGEARRDERLRGAPLYGWCRHCRVKVDDRHIRKLRPQRDPRMAIYWLGEPDDDAQELEPVVEHARRDDAATGASGAASQLPLFQLLA
ncbi:MAG: hypothetical protein AABO58_00770 [Acidobacteriota bacterium]